MKIGANGCAYGWSAENKVKWAKIKTDPGQQEAWARLPDVWKFIASNGTENIPADPLKSITYGYAGTNYTPVGAVLLKGKDAIRGKLLGMIVNYMTYEGLLTPEQKVNAVDVLTTVCKQNTDLNKVDISDLDNMHYSWIAQTLLSIATKDDFPDISNTLVNHSQYLAWRDKIIWLSTYAIGSLTDTAVFPLQGTNYDPGTMKQILVHMKQIENFSGETYFPEYKKKIPLIAEGMKAYFCPGFEQTFQWSDNQRVHYNYAYNNWDIICVFAALNNNDPELWFMWDEIARIEKAANRTQPFSSYSIFSPWYDPYAPRATAEQFANRPKHFNDSVRGLSFFHTSYDKLKSSSFFSSHWGSNSGDHNPNTGDFGLRRNNEWAWKWAIGYPATNYADSCNSLKPFGAYQTRQYYIQKDYKTGSNWIYTKGSKHNKGINVKDANGVITVVPYKQYSLEYFNERGNVIEQTREILGYHMKDGSDLIFVYDTLETPTGNDGVSTVTNYFSKKVYDNVPNNIKGFKDMKGDLPDRMKIARYRHNLNFFLPTNDVVFGNNDWTFYADAAYADHRAYIKGKEKVTLTTFVKNYSSGIYNNDNPVKDALGYPIIDQDTSSLGMLGYSLRIVPENEQFGRMHWLNAVHARSEGDKDIIYTEIDGGLVAEKPGVERVTVKFLPEFSITSEDLSGTPPISNDLVINVNPGTKKIIINLP